ncbi:MAG: AsmA-like C-terminal region-containing protein, partial [Kiloniellaceae bacterium]
DKWAGDKGAGDDRLALIRRLNLDPRAAVGDVAARIGLRFPLVSDLGLEQIEIGARANLRQAGVKKLLLGLDASDGDLALEVDKSGMILTGPVSLAGVPFELNWIEAFSDDVPEPTRIEIEAARIDATARAAFGIDTAPYLDGPVSVHLTAVRDTGGQTTVKAAINLQEAVLRVAPLFWEKPEGDTGAAYFTLVLEGDRPVGIRDLEISAGTLRAQGAGTFSDDGKAIGTLRLDELGFNGTSLREVAIDFEDDKIMARAGGGNLDATPWLSRDEEAPTQTASPTDPPVQPRTPDEPATPAYRPLHLVARGLNAVYFGADRYFRDVDLEVERGAFGWNRISFSGRVPQALWHMPGRAVHGAGARAETPQPIAPSETGYESDLNPAKPKPAEATQTKAKEGPRTLKIEFGPAAAGGRSLRVTAEDMGAALRALDALDTVEGGRLEIVGHSDGPLPTATLRARIKARNYVLVGAPTLARLLTVASFTGISDLLSGDGIRFRRLVGEVTVRGGKVHTDLLRAYGPALGLTAKGDVSVDGSQTNIRGTVVPAYTVNRILGKIPLLGPLLTGGEGEGFIAITYKMSGPILDPKVTVNPLSALAPGFLRNLFSAGGGGQADQDGTPSALPQRADP